MNPRPFSIYATTGILLLAVLATARASDAQCVCEEYSSTCRRSAGASDVFIATAVAVEKRPGGSERGSATLAVAEVFKGSPETNVTFSTGGECDPRFELGEKYLVYAKRINGKLITSGCGAVKAIEDAEEDLRFQWSRRDRAPSASVFGYIRGLDPPRYGQDERPLTLTLEGGGHTYESTGPDITGGAFDINDVLPGEYRLTLADGDAFSVNPRRNIGVRAGACLDLGEVDIRATSAHAAGTSVVWHEELSPSVVGTFVTRQGVLTYLLLWRGKVGTSRFDSGEENASSGTLKGWMTYNNVTQKMGGDSSRIEYEIGETIARVNGVTVDLAGGKNILLVDNVDRLAGSTVRAIAGNLGLDDAPDLPELLRQNPDAVRFLRCGERLPIAWLSERNRIICDVRAR